MNVGRHMGAASDVRRPTHPRGIHRSAEQEASIEQTVRYVEEKALDRLLSIGGVGSEIREIAGRGDLGWPMDAGVDAAVQRLGAARPEARFESGQRRSTSKTEDEIEGAESVAWDPRHVFASIEQIERHRRIE